DFSLSLLVGNISGNVIDETTGLPLVGLVTVSGLDGSRLYSTYTDSHGNFNFVGIPPGNYIIQAQSNNDQSNIHSIIVVANDTVVTNFSLVSDPGIIVGTISSKVSGSGLLGTITLMDSAGVILAQTPTNSSGHYRINNIAPGYYILQAQATSYQTSLQGINVEANQSIEADFALLQDPGQITGTVVSQNGGMPLVGATVAISLNNIIIASTLTDSSGNYIIPALMPGFYIIQAQAQNYQVSSQGALIASDQTSNANFALVPDPGSIAGIITDENTNLPIANAAVNLNANGNIFSALTDSTGFYILTGIAPGSYVIQV